MLLYTELEGCQEKTEIFLAVGEKWRYDGERTGPVGRKGRICMKRDSGRDVGLEALDQCAYMVLAVTDEEGLPYCMPLNGVRVGDCVYFHSAQRGEKLACLRVHPQVCLTAVGHQRVVQAEYETEFTSAVARGTACEVRDPEEQRQALRAICRRYAPDFPDRVEEVIEKYLSRTAVWRIDLEQVSGRKRLCQG